MVEAVRFMGLKLLKVSFLPNADFNWYYLCKVRSPLFPLSHSCALSLLSHLQQEGRREWDSFGYLSMLVVASELSEESRGDGWVGCVADGHFSIVVPVQSNHGSYDFHKQSAKFGFICMGFGSQEAIEYGVSQRYGLLSAYQVGNMKNDWDTRDYGSSGLWVKRALTVIA
jgi:hypothetical protein